MFGSKYIPFESHEHRGYRYECQEDNDGDCIKKFHEAHGPNGEQLSLDASPYSFLNKEQFVQLLDKALEAK